MRPNGGKVLFRGEDVTALPPEQRGVGLVFQNYALYPHMTAEENITFPLENLKGSKSCQNQKCLPKRMRLQNLCRSVN